MGDVRVIAAPLSLAALVAACLIGIWVATPLLAAASALAAGALIVRLAGQALGHARLTRALRRDSDLGRHDGVAVRWRPLAPGAAVAGFRYPQIYCDPSLTRELTHEELTAVVLHERHHQVRRDPLRLLLLSAIEPLVGSLPAGRRWLTSRRAQIEVAADRFALSQGVRRPELARAILRLGDAPAPAPASAGFASAQELRLRALLEDQAEVPAGSFPVAPRWLTAAGLGLVAAACGLAILHHVVVAGDQVGCTLVGC